LSDLFRERGAFAEALEHVSKAVSLYRGSDDRLGLANAIRLQALSTSEAGNREGKLRCAGEKHAISMRLWK
jgi:hypothetical protein